MSKACSIIEKAVNWLGTGACSPIKKILVIAVIILAIYRLGYVIGKLLFHFTS